MAQQERGRLCERVLIPVIHFVLLGFLPLWWMRRYVHPAYASGCGQLFLARRAAYHEVGGHAAIRTTLHDGIMLPRAFRAAGRRTDLGDAADLAACRLDRGGAAVWGGVGKDGAGGRASAGRWGRAALLLFGGQVLPFLRLGCAAWLSPVALMLSANAAMLAYLPRLLAAWRFGQSWLGAMLHPVGVALLLAIQWHAL